LPSLAVLQVLSSMRNPVLIELTRGRWSKSACRAVAVVRADGEIAAAVGDVAAPIFPRSAIKPLQAIPFVETGAADRFGFGPPEIALASASHSGTQAHTALVRSMLGRAGLSTEALACGVHERWTPRRRGMIRSVQRRRRCITTGASTQACWRPRCTRGSPPGATGVRPSVHLRIARVLRAGDIGYPPTCAAQTVLGAQLGDAGAG
jgi:hypothetical protein